MQQSAAVAKHPAPTAAARPQTVEFTVPEGTAAGQQLRVTTGSGQQLLVVVPPGAVPGQKLRVEMPPPPAAKECSAATPQHGQLVPPMPLSGYSSGAHVQVHCDHLPGVGL